MRNVGAGGEVVGEVGAQDSSCGLASHEWWGWWRGNSEFKVRIRD